MKLLNFKNVLCLAPHPDDAEYSMAGLVIKYKDTNFDILCLTQGGYCDPTTGFDRHQEVKNSWKETNNSNYALYFSDIEVLRERGQDEWISYIEKNFTHVKKYDCIMTTSDHDSHHEHVIVSSLAAPLSRVTPYSIIQYKSPSTLDSWIPNLFVPLEDFVLQTKKRMLSHFKSQLSKPYFKETVLDAFHTNFQCLKKSKGFIESYKIITYYE